jgi:small subunit ribosomal protein S20
LANTSSAEKRTRQNEKRFAHNRWYRSRYRTFVKRARFYIAQGDAEQSVDAIRRAVQALDRAAQRNVIHANKASRLKSRLAKAYAKIAA